MSESQRSESQPFPIVGVGASAGGLEAFTQLLKHLPTDTGMAFVLVQHLDPAHKSALTSLLSKVTSLSVREVTNNLAVKANHIYVIPPNASMTISEGVLKLSVRDSHGTHRSIDRFFKSLAQDQNHRAIGIILSGTATDGTLGLEAIKEQGGIAFAQDESAKYDSMPRSAVTAGCVDFVLSPEGIAQELARIARHPYVVSPHVFRAAAERESAMEGERKATPLPSGGHGTPRTGARQIRTETETAPVPPSEESSFKSILLLLRNHSGVDFSLYKSNTIQRRVARRVVLNKLSSLKEYAAFLKGNARELDSLYSDVLISVTSFFRNPEAFDALKRSVFPKLLRQRRDDPVRVWVLGCSTGQEAYSIAMSFAEFCENMSRVPKLQVFATDLNEALLDKARHGLYTKTLAQDISPERLRRFFVEEDAGYRVSKGVREQVVFARQNLMNDPPFSRMDLISCRNVLIYLEPSLQRKIIPAFHYALKPEGFLFLGASEAIGQFTELFEPADKKQKIFAKKPGVTPGFNLSLTKGNVARSSSGVRQPDRPTRDQDLPEELRGEVGAQREADRLAINRFSPPGVLVNADLKILQFRGSTTTYLEPPTGKASFDVLKMAREGLKMPMRAALNKVKKEGKPVRRENIRIEANGRPRTMNFEVIPLKNLKERFYLILFELAQAGKEKLVVPAAPQPKVLGKRQESRRVADLELELAETRDYLQSIQEQSEASNEELHASNEEVQSSNEELQSINEELETSKEELESANEELTTVNEEMAHRNIELTRLSGDLNNLHLSISTPILLLARDLSVRRFTLQAEKLFNLMATDIGRPLSGIKSNLEFPKLEELVREVIDAVQMQEREVQSKDGRWYLLRVRPYMTLDNKIDGAVLLLVDIDALKRSEQEAKAAREYAEATIRTARDPLVVLGPDLRVESANEAFFKTFKVSREETENALIYQVGNGQWQIPKLRQLLERVIPEKTFFNDLEVTHDFPHIGRRTMLLNARRMDKPNGGTERILLGIEDVTQRQVVQQALRESEERYRTLFDLGPVAVYSIDASGVIREFNRRAVELWGREPATGDKNERFCGSVKMFRPDGSLMPHRECPMADVVSGKKKEVHDEEVIIERPDGSRRTVIVNIRPLRNHRGEVSGAINCFYDISERKRHEILQRRELEDARRLQEISAQLIHQNDIQALYGQILDAALGVMRAEFGSIQMLSSEPGHETDLHLLAFRGYSPEAAAAWEWIPAGEPTSCGMALKSGRRIIVGDIETCDWMAGTEVPLLYRQEGIRSLQSTPLLSRTGDKLGMISTCWKQPHDPSERDLGLFDVLARQAADLIERVTADQALRQAHQQLADRALHLETLVHERTAALQDTVEDLEHFSYSITHDMRAPLRAMQGFGNLLMDQGSAGQTPDNTYLKRIVDAAQRMDALIQDSLQYAKAVREHLPLGPVEPVPVLRGVLESYPDLQAPHVEIEMVEPLPPVIANEAGLAQCFSNLLSNAIKFVKPDKVPRVRIWAETLDGYVRLCFEDNGIGIPQEYRARIFKMFQQLDKSYEGTGIGLALVRKTAERMGGKVGVESEFGKGSRFWLELKRAES